MLEQHAPARRFFDGTEELGYEIPALRSEIELIGYYGARVLALTLNDRDLEAAERESLRRQVENEAGVPALYPLEPAGAAALVPLVRAHLESERR